MNHHYQWTDTSQASGSTTEAPPKRPCGRPKGSKNKAKGASPMQVGPSEPSEARNVDQVQSSENSVLLSDVPFLVLRILRPVLRVLRPRTPLRICLCAATDPSPILYCATSTWRPPPPLEVEMHPRGTTSKMSPTAVLATASGASRTRGVAQPTSSHAALSTPLDPSPLNMSDTSRLGLITHVENENDFTSFVSSSGIGEENDEDEDVDPNKHATASQA
ncbi:hypothetical protein B0H11DRAFT_2358964 [Mycena galericulata]|nr:hypothetical protein B0H11DRAFT_2358964 [Mycena galericulata]